MGSSKAGGPYIRAQYDKYRQGHFSGKTRDVGLLLLSIAAAYVRAAELLFSYVDARKPEPNEPSARDGTVRVYDMYSNFVRSPITTGY